MSLSLKDLGIEDPFIEKAEEKEEPEVVEKSLSLSSLDIDDPYDIPPPLTEEQRYDRFLGNQSGMDSASLWLEHTERPGPSNVFSSVLEGFWKGTVDLYEGLEHFIVSSSNYFGRVLGDTSPDLETSKQRDARHKKELSTQNIFLNAENVKLPSKGGLFENPKSLEMMMEDREYFSIAGFGLGYLMTMAAPGSAIHTGSKGALKIAGAGMRKARPTSMLLAKRAELMSKWGRAADDAWRSLTVPHTRVHLVKEAVPKSLKSIDGIRLATQAERYEALGKLQSLRHISTDALKGFAAEFGTHVLKSSPVLFAEGLVWEELMARGEHQDFDILGMSMSSRFLVPTATAFGLPALLPAAKFTAGVTGVAKTGKALKTMAADRRAIRKAQREFIEKNRTSSEQRLRMEEDARKYGYDLTDLDNNLSPEQQILLEASEKTELAVMAAESEGEQIFIQANKARKIKPKQKRLDKVLTAIESEKPKLDKLRENVRQMRRDKNTMVDIYLNTLNDLQRKGLSHTTVGKIERQLQREGLSFRELLKVIGREGSDIDAWLKDVGRGFGKHTKLSKSQIEAIKKRLGYLGQKRKRMTIGETKKFMAQSRLEKQKSRKVKRLYKERDKLRGEISKIKGNDFDPSFDLDSFTSLGIRVNKKARLKQQIAKRNMRNYGFEAGEVELHGEFISAFLSRTAAFNKLASHLNMPEIGAIPRLVHRALIMRDNVRRRAYGHYKIADTMKLFENVDGETLTDWMLHTVGKLDESDKITVSFERGAIRGFAGEKGGMIEAGPMLRTPPTPLQEAGLIHLRETMFAMRDGVVRGGGRDFGFIGNYVPTRSQASVSGRARQTTMAKRQLDHAKFMEQKQGYRNPFDIAKGDGSIELDFRKLFTGHFMGSTDEAAFAEVIDTIGELQSRLVAMDKSEFAGELSNYFYSVVGRGDMSMRRAAMLTDRNAYRNSKILRGALVNTGDMGPGAFDSTMSYLSSSMYHSLIGVNHKTLMKQVLQPVYVGAAEIGLRSSSWGMGFGYRFAERLLSQHKDPAVIGAILGQGKELLSQDSINLIRKTLQTQRNLPRRFKDELTDDLVNHGGRMFSKRINLAELNADQIRDFDFVKGNWGIPKKMLDVLTHLPGKFGMEVFTFLDKVNRISSFSGASHRWERAMKKEGWEKLIQDLTMSEQQAIIRAVKTGGTRAGRIEYSLIQAERINYMYSLAERGELLSGGIGRFMPFVHWGHNQIMRLSENVALLNKPGMKLRGSKKMAYRMGVPLAGATLFSKLTGVDYPEAAFPKMTVQMKNHTLEWDTSLPPASVLMGFDPTTPFTSALESNATWRLWKKYLEPYVTGEGQVERLRKINRTRRERVRQESLGVGIPGVLSITPRKKGK